MSLDATGGEQTATTTETTTDTSSAQTTSQSQSALLTGGDQQTTTTEVAEPFLKELPGAEDKDGWNQLYAKLGRPETAEGYELPLPEGDDGSFAKTTSQWMHEAGLNKQQAQALATQWNAHQEAQRTAQAEANQKYQEECVAIVKKEWGANFDANLTLARSALSTFAPEGFVDYLNQTGQANNPMMLNMLQKIGSAISEEKLIGNPKDSSQSGEKSIADRLWGSAS